MAEEKYEPKPEHKFTFGLWTVGNRGRDPFGDAVRPTLPPDDAVRMLAEIAAAGGNGGAGKFEKGRNEQLLAQNFDRAELASKGLRYERLDQLTIDILLGVR